MVLNVSFRVWYFETIHSGVSQLLCCDASIHQFQSVTSLKTLTSPGLCSVGAFGSGTWLQLFGRPGPTPTPSSISSVQFSRSVVSDSLRPHESQHARPPCPSPTPGVQTQVHWVGDAIQPSHPVSSPSPPAFKPSQHQSLFQWVNSSHEVAKVLEFQLQHHSFQRNPRVDLLKNGLVGSLCSPRDSQKSSPTPQFKRINSSVLSFLEKP